MLLPVLTKHWLIGSGFLLLILFSGTLRSEPVPISRVEANAIGSYAEIFFEPAERLSIDEARSLFADNAGVTVDSDTLNFGIGVPPHWLKFVVDNPTESTVNKVLSVENAWLDQLAIHIFYDDEQQLKYALGDSLVQTDRPVDNRFYVLEYAFKPGKTTLYLRVAGSDAMLLPIYLNDRSTFTQRFEFANYSYGLLYGILAALMLYKLMLFGRLLDAPHLFYSLYLLSFIACNLAYTGHGFRWLWPQAVHWQQWANPVLMVVTGVCGLVFASSLLATRKTLPRLYWAVCSCCLAVLIGLGVAYYMAQIQTALILALVFVVLFTIIMVLLGFMALRAGNVSAKFFLPAAVAGAISATITVLAVANILPYSNWTYRAVEIGMVIQALLFGLALSGKFHLIDIKPLHAVQSHR